MGGSGGGYFYGGLPPDVLVKRTREAQEQAVDAAFETDVGQHLGSLLATFNDRDVDQLREMFHEFTSHLEEEVEGTIETLYGGSVSKHTYVDGLSDVDALVLLNKSELADQGPVVAKSFLANRLRTKYGDDAVSEGTLAVTVTAHETTIQLVPALRHGETFKIAGSDGRTWSEVNPRGFADALTNANQGLDGKLVPCIKLIKGIVATLPEQRQITGYHTEALAIKVFKDYHGTRTTKVMLRHFFEHSPWHILNPIQDSSGQSVHVDDYLGPANSLERRIVADTLGRIGRKIRNADGAKSLDRWKELFQ